MYTYIHTHLHLDYFLPLPFGSSHSSDEAVQMSTLNPQRTLASKHCSPKKGMVSFW